MAVDKSITQPAPLGNEYTTITLVQGQSSYNSSTGQVISAQTLRLSTVLAAEAVGLSVSGTYEARVLLSGSGGNTTATLYWYAAGSSTKSSVADLSAEYLRVLAIGN